MRFLTLRNALEKLAQTLPGHRWTTNSQHFFPRETSRLVCGRSISNRRELKRDRHQFDSQQLQRYLEVRHDGVMPNEVLRETSVVHLNMQNREQIRGNKLHTPQN